MGELVALLLLVWLLAVAVLGLRHRRLLAQLWAEPVLRRPVLIIESDDWGAGPLAQTEALQKLAALLSTFSDSEGRHPKMTLGVVLAIADTEAMRRADLSVYRRLTLEHECFAELRQSMADGIEKGVFAAQLHGMEHYWPPALMQAANDDESVRQWLLSDALPQTETLPSALQSRWLDGSVLPAQQLDGALISAAVDEELALYKKIFSEPTKVVVPPTFVWNQMVEESWARGGVEVVVTPGQRYESRDENGVPCSVSEPHYNGEQAESGLNYVVRNDYFEPSLGHDPERALQALQRKSNAGRPTLLETHRFNFVGDEKKVDSARQAVDDLLTDALRQYPAIAFLSTVQLAKVLAGRDSDWINESLLVRLRVWLVRQHQDYRLRKFFLLSGFVFIYHLLRWSSAKTSGWAGDES